MALLDQEEDGGFVLLEAQRPLRPSRLLGWLEPLKLVQCCEMFCRVITCHDLSCRRLRNPTRGGGKTCWRQVPRVRVLDCMYGLKWDANYAIYLGRNFVVTNEVVSKYWPEERSYPRTTEAIWTA